MAKLKGELQADNGDALHPHTSADVVFMEDGTSAEEKIKSIDQKITDIDVSSDVRQVINERVNANTSKPLNSLIHEWLTSAKTAILEAISTLTTHVTNQHTATKNHVTSKVDAARDNIKSHITTATSGLKVYQPHSSNVLATLCTAYAFSNGAQSYMGRFIAKRSGVIRVCFLTTNGTDNSRITVYTNPDVQATLSSSHGMNSSYTSWEGLPLNTNIHNVGSPTYMTMKTVMEIGHKAVNNNKNCIFDMYVHEGQCLYFSGWYVGTATLKILGTEVVL